MAEHSGRLEYLEDVQVRFLPFQCGVENKLSADPVTNLKNIKKTPEVQWRTLYGIP